MAETMAPHKVLFVCQIMAHYRYGVHTILDRRANLNCTFASDPDGSHYQLETMPTTAIERHLILRNRYFRSLTWQQGVLRHCLWGKFDSFVFTGDVRIVSTWVGAAMARLRRRRVVFWTMGWRRPESGIKRYVRLLFYRIAHHLMVYSEGNKSIGVALGYPPSQISVIGNSEQSEGQRSDGILTFSPPQSVVEQPVLGAVARLTHAKHFELLIGAAAELGRRGLPVTVLLAGEGPARHELEREASKRRVDLKCIGPLFGEAHLRAFYDSLDLTVIPSAAGLSVIQSLRHGIPVISDDDRFNQGPEWEAIKPGVTGDTYRQGSTAALSDTIYRWLSARNANNDGTSVKCVAEYASHWTPDGQAARMEAVILQHVVGLSIATHASESSSSSITT